MTSVSAALYTLEQGFAVCQYHSVFSQDLDGVERPGCFEEGTGLCSEVG